MRVQTRRPFIAALIGRHRYVLGMMDDQARDLRAGDRFSFDFSGPARGWFKVPLGVSILLLPLSIAVLIAFLAREANVVAPVTRATTMTMAVSLGLAVVSGVVLTIGLVTRVTPCRVTFKDGVLEIERSRLYRFEPGTVRWIGVSEVTPWLVSLDVGVAEGCIRFRKALHPDDARRVGGAIIVAGGVPVRELVDGAAEARVADAAGTYGVERQFSVFLAWTFGIVLLLIITLPIVEGLRSRGWPSTTGTVVRSVHEFRGNEHQRQEVTEIAYAYRVGARTYENDRFRYGGTADDDARVTVRAHPVGSSIRVFYDPWWPGQSALIPGVAPCMWVLLALALLPMAATRRWYREGPRHDLFAVLKPYRVERLGSGRATEIELAKWTVPQVIHEAVWSRRRREVRWLAVLTAVASLLCVGIFGWVKRRYAPGSPMGGEVALLVVFTAIVGAWVVAFERMKRVPGEFRLTSEGIAGPPKEGGRRRWTSCTGYRVEFREDSVAPYRVLSLLPNDANRSVIPLPGDERDQIILAEVRKHLREVPRRA